MLRDTLPEDASFGLQLAAEEIDYYLDALQRERGYGATDAADLTETLRPLLPDLAKAFDPGGCLRAPAVRELATTMKGRSSLAKRQRQELLSLAEWLERRIPPLTDERVAELAALAQRTGVPVPDSDDVAQILRAAEALHTADGGRLAVAVYLAAFRGLGATELCGLQADAVDWSQGTAHVRESPPYAFPLDEWEEHHIRQLTVDCSPADRILRTNDGRPLRPRYLQQELARLVKSLGTRLRDPLTFERLRDHAVHCCLDNGGSIQDVAKVLGYARVADARHRYGGECWAYLADREGQWFTVEAAAAAENTTVPDLAAWTAQGLPYAQRGRRVYVRKEDMRLSGATPTSGVRVRPSRGANGDAEVNPRAEDAPIVQFVASLEGETRVSDEALESLMLPQLWEPSRQLAALQAKLRSVFTTLQTLHAAGGEATSVQRVSKALDWPCEQLELHRSDDLSHLRGVLMNQHPFWRGLDANLRQVDFTGPSVALDLITRTVNSPQGVDFMSESLDDFVAEASFWLLVDRYLPHLLRHVDAVKRLHGVVGDKFEPVWIGCLAYSFFVSVFAASPEVHVDPRWSAPEPEIILFEALRHWLVLTLNACGALQPRPRRELSFGRSFTRERDDQRFVEAFEDRWRSSLRYHRPPWSFDVVPIVSPFDIVRYAHLTFRRAGLGKKEIAQEATDHIVYLSKLPPNRLLLPPERLSVGPLTTLLYLVYHPLLEAQFNAAIRDVAQARNLDRDALEELLPPSLPEASRALFDRVWSAFDFTRGTEEDGSGGRDWGSLAAFPSYLKMNAQWHFRKLCHESAGLPAASLEDLGHGPVATQSASDMGAELSLFMDMVGAFGHAYIRIEWAAELTGESACWLQRHAHELGAVRAGDRLKDEGRLVDPSLPPDTYLLPYDSSFYDRVSKLRKRRRPRRTDGGDV